MIDTNEKAMPALAKLNFATFAEEKMQALDVTAFNRIKEGRHENPNSVLGPIRIDGPRTREKIRENPHHSTTVRAFLPNAVEAWISTESGTVTQPMRPVSQCGLFEVSCGTDLFQVDSGRYKIMYSDGNHKMSIHDPCLLYTSPSPRDRQKSRMPSSA